MPRSMPVREGFALAVPVGLLWILGCRALDFWWMGDDPCNLLDAAEGGIWRPFFVPVGSFLQPLLSFSLRIDLDTFGLEPRAFYAHQLVSFTVLLAVAFVFLRAYLPPLAAGLALALFTASTPALAVAQQLMNRHYLEGLVLTLASFFCFRRALLADRRWLSALGAGLYLLATAAKEVFVPLVLCLPFLAGSPPRRESPGRWQRHGLPYLLVLAVYGIWRLSMLGWGNSLSAYGALSGELRGGDLMRRVPQLLGWIAPWQALAGGLLLIAAAGILARRSRLFAAGLGVTLAAIVLPLIPVAARLEPRHLFVAAFAAAAVAAAALDAVAASLGGPWRDRARILAGAGLTVLALTVSIGSPIWSRLAETSRRFHVEGAFLLDGSRDGLLLTRLPHSHHVYCLSCLDRDLLGQASGPGFCGDLCYCSGAFPDETFWEADEDRVVEVTRTAASGCDARRPLAVDMRHDARRERLSWRLEPLDGGDYSALLLFDGPRPEVSTPIPIPPQGSLPFRLTEPLRFVLRYRSPAGWQTYSPIHVVEPGGRARIASEDRHEVPSSPSPP